MLIHEHWVISCSLLLFNIVGFQFIYAVIEMSLAIITRRGMPMLLWSGGKLHLFFLRMNWQMLLLFETMLTKALNLTKP